MLLPYCIDTTMPTEVNFLIEASTVSDLGSTAHLGIILVLTYLILNYFLNNCSYYYTAPGDLQDHYDAFCLCPGFCISFLI